MKALSSLTITDPMDTMMLKFKKLKLVKSSPRNEGLCVGPRSGTSLVAVDEDALELSCGNGEPVLSHTFSQDLMLQEHAETAVTEHAQ